LRVLVIPWRLLLQKYLNSGIQIAIFSPHI
jgi:hypothetical protein